jgi:hypothetical protein
VGYLAADGALLACSFGMAPAPLVLVPKGPPVLADGLPVGTVEDVEEMNVPSFGMCTSPQNPAVAEATAAALGALTPMPCLPVIVTPWSPGAPTVLIGGVPALTEESVCMCAWGGEVRVLEPGQFRALAE